jgi:hypothetical protein
VNCRDKYFFAEVLQGVNAFVFAPA